MTTHTDVAIIGGGQAGLSVSWYLGRAGVDHVVFEAQTPTHAWADTRWDNFTLVTPNWHCRLPGYPYAGPDPDGFMTRDEVVADTLALEKRVVRALGSRAEFEALDRKVPHDEPEFREVT